jgi:formamidopyrimidine-DNA glycosylase
VPELPEVEYERRRLHRAMARQRIQRVITRRANLRYEFPADFSHRLDGRTVRRVNRRAKYLLVELGSGDTLVMHLGMSGSFRVERSATPRGRSSEDSLDAHDHVIFEMSGGARVVFNDPRRFGFMMLMSHGEIDTHATLGRLGPEPLATRFDSSVLAKALARRKTTLKAALLDQRVVAGLGNIYVSEALHRSRLSPTRAASTLVTRSGEPRPALDDLVKAIREVLRIAIQRQYRVASGFSRKDPFLVYDREGLRCLRRGCTGTIKRIVQGGRSTFYCPVCQT